MSLPKDDAAVLSAQWIEGVLLKRDVFSTVERGRFRLRDGEVDAVLRRLDQVPWWSFIPARHLFARERREFQVMALQSYCHTAIKVRRREFHRMRRDYPRIQTIEPA